REVEIWRDLKHQNILPFIGVCEDLAPLPVLISPFCKFGHISNYLKKNPGVHKKELVLLGVGSGLQFLHDNQVVHGDLKVASGIPLCPTAYIDIACTWQNVLVNKRGVPCICDFGISKILSCRSYVLNLKCRNGTVYGAGAVFRRQWAWN
ncbi:kinase-like domain-containing protein, partial [Mycena albidolilacea]